MDENQERWEKLSNLPDEYERNPAISARAIAEIQARQPKKKGWLFKNWKAGTACAASVLLVLAIGIPVYKHFQAPPTTTVFYYGAEEVVSEEVDAASFVLEHNLSVCYYDGSLDIRTQIAKIESTKENAYLVQDIFNFENLDQVNFKAIIKKNATFDFYNGFSRLEKTTVVNTINVQYSSTTIMPTNKENVFAKFTYQSVDYYLEILTYNQAEESIATYVNMLIG